MNLTNFTEIVAAGANNPECSFYVGSFMGQFLGIKIFLYAVLIYVLVRAVDKLAIEPIIKWVRDKIFKR